MDAHTIVRAFALVARVGRLNPNAGEIGPGMLASLVQEAREIAGAVGDGGEYIGATNDHHKLVDDGLLFRRLLSICVDQIKLATFADILDGIEDAHDYVSPTTFVGARAHIQNVIEQTERIHPS